MVNGFRASGEPNIDFVVHVTSRSQLKARERTRLRSGSNESEKIIRPEAASVTPVLFDLTFAFFSTFVANDKSNLFNPILSRPSLESAAGRNCGYGQ